MPRHDGTGTASRAPKHRSGLRNRYRGGRGSYQRNGKHRQAETYEPLSVIRARQRRDRAARDGTPLPPERHGEHHSGQDLPPDEAGYPLVTPGPRR